MAGSELVRELLQNRKAEDSAVVGSFGHADGRVALLLDDALEVLD